VMEQGRMALEGLSEIGADDHVQRVYLGAA
jgi:hypothetical protein